MAQFWVLATYYVAQVLIVLNARPVPQTVSAEPATPSLAGGLSRTGTA